MAPKKQLHPKMVLWNKAATNYSISVGVSLKDAMKDLKATVTKERSERILSEWAGMRVAAKKTKKSCAGHMPPCPEKCIRVKKSKSGTKSHCRITKAKKAAPSQVAGYWF